MIDDSGIGAQSGLEHASRQFIFRKHPLISTPARFVLHVSFRRANAQSLDRSLRQLVSVTSSVLIRWKGYDQSLFSLSPRARGAFAELV